MREFEINDSQVADFKRDGFITVDRIISDDEVSLLRARYDELFKGKFDTGLFGHNKTAVLAIEEPGTYKLLCTPHPWMKATIVVTGTPTAATLSDGASTTGASETLAVSVGAAEPVTTIVAFIHGWGVQRSL